VNWSKIQDGNLKVGYWAICYEILLVKIGSRVCSIGLFEKPLRKKRQVIGRMPKGYIW